VPSLARVAAVALLPAAVIPLLAVGDERWNVFAVLSPIEAICASVGLWLLARAVGTGRLGTGAAAGLLTAIGVLTTAASIGLVKFTVERVGGVGAALAVIVLCGAIAVLAAGLACGPAALRTAGVSSAASTGLVLAVFATGVLLWALIARYDGESSLWSEVGEVTSAEFFFEPALAVALLITGIAVLMSWPRPAGSLLIGTGALTSVHFAGVIVAAARAVGEVGEVREGGFVGLLAGAVALLAGAIVLHPPGEDPA
jgi:hypothetical protein